MKNYNKSQLELKLENKIKYQPYYKGTLHTINSSTSHIYLNNTSNNRKFNSIRLYSANNSNAIKNKSQDKLKINNNNIPHIYGARSTSVKPEKNFLIQKNKNMNYIQSIDLNYQKKGLNSNNNASNSILFQRTRRIIYEADNELAEEYDKLRKIWKEAGVTDIYMDNFETVTNNKNNSKKEILQNLKNEENQMIKFKEEMMKVVSDIIKRENDIKNIKDLNKKYLDIKTKMNINPKDDIKMNEYNNEKIKLEQEIERCLTLIRLHGINVVASFKKFNMRYSHLLNAGKIDLDFLKNKYGFDINYLMKLKTDLDFLKDTEIGDLYQFNIKGKDPFLVSLSIEQLSNRYKVLPLSDDMEKQIKLYNHLLNEVEIFSMMKNDYSISNNFNISNNPTYKYGFFSGISKYDESNNNLDINNSNNYTNNILNTTPNNSKKYEHKLILSNINNIKYKQKLLNKKNDFYGKNKPMKLPTNINTSAYINQSSQNMKEYENLKKNLAGPYYSKVENDIELNNNNKISKIKSITNSMVEEENTEINEDDIIKEVETRVNKEVINKLYEVENRVKRQMEEKLKKDQERIEEEQKKLKKEKEKIEEIRRKEEEKRMKEKEKWEKKELERMKKEEEERIKYEEEEKKKKEENERYKKEIEEKFMNEIELRFKREENERKRREEENELIKRELELKIKNELEEERIKREREEKEKEEIKERIRIEEIENIRKGVRKDEYERIKREEMDKIEIEREERIKREQEWKIKLEEELKLMNDLNNKKKENEEKSKNIKDKEKDNSSSKKNRSRSKSKKSKTFNKSKSKSKSKSKDKDKLEYNIR